MKICLFQMNAVVGDLEGNSSKIIEAAKRAEALGCDLMITPELALVGYPPRDLLLYPNFVNEAWNCLVRIAEQHTKKISLLVGFPETNPSGEGRPLFNSVALLRNGRVEKTFRKSLLPTYDVFDEDRYFEPVSSPNVFDMGHYRVGVTICEDVWNDRDFFKRRRYHIDPVETLMQSGVNVVINLSASPFAVNKQNLREKMLGNIAKKYQTKLLYVNQVGANDDLVFDGCSSGYDESGSLLFRGKAFEEDLVVHDLDVAGSAISSYRSPEEEQVYKALVLGTRDYVKKCGFQSVLLGLSGGIDSAVTAVIAAEALGSDQVMGVMMPSPYSSGGSVTDAEELAKNLKIKALKIPISDLMKQFEASLAPAFKGLKADVAEENVQARIRGTLLMGLSNKFKSLLLTTGNKSELAVGYCTLYGDMNGGLAVISDVPKTMIYRLANWINRTATIIPTASITKPPSAELRPDQKDQDSLPPYDLLDAILEGHIEKRMGARELVKMGFREADVKRVLQLVNGAEFKRKQAAPGLKVTDQAFGIGWRMPVAKRFNAESTTVSEKNNSLAMVVPMNKLKKASVVGLGKLGAPLLACLAERGFDVIGTDVDPEKVKAIGEGRAPVRETGLDDMISRNASRIHSTNDTTEAVKNSDVTFLIVPTPSNPDGAFSTKFVEAAVEPVARALREKNGYHVVVLVSTVMPGSTEIFKTQLEKASGKRCVVDFGVCYNPEFIALGSVIRDFLNSDFILIGESDPRTGNLLSELYAKVCPNSPVRRMNFVNAEITKLALNTFVTTKISYANMLARLCTAIPGADVDTVTEALGKDTRVGSKYLKGAVGYGGPCFPRDNIALTLLMKRNHVDSSIAQATDAFNREHVQWLMQVAKTHSPNKKVGILGLSYKPSTEVFEQSQGVMLAQAMTEAGYTVKAYDPAVNANSKALPKEQFASSVTECIEKSDIVFVMTAWDAFKGLELSQFARTESPRVVIDCWRIMRDQPVPQGVIYVLTGCGDVSFPIGLKKAA